MKIKTVEVPIYKAIVNYFIEPNEKKAREYLCKKYPKIDEKDFFNAEAITVSFEDEGVTVIWIRGIGKSYYADLVHETIHAAFDILEKVRIKVDSDNHEALTYLVDLLLKGIIK